MSGHKRTLDAMRVHFRAHRFKEALLLGKEELARGHDSAELLVLMATAGQMDDGESCSLADIRTWLELATQLDPGNVDALIEHGCYLDAVADEPAMAVPVFEDALERSLGYLEAALEGLESAVETADAGLRAKLGALQERTIAAWELSSKLT